MVALFILKSTYINNDLIEIRKDAGSPIGYTTRMSGSIVYKTKKSCKVCQTQISVDRPLPDAFTCRLKSTYTTRIGRYSNATSYVTSKSKE